MKANVRITAKGQITIPAQVRASLGLATGDLIEFVQLPDGSFAIMAASHSIRTLKDKARKPDKPVSPEDMRRAINRLWR